MNRRLVFLLALMSLLLVVAWFVRRQSQDTHDEMLALLEEVKARTPIENKFLGTRDLLELDEQLKHATSVSEQINVLWERAPVALRLGKNNEAIGDLQRVLELIPNFASGLPAEELQEFETELYYNLALASMRKGETENCVDCQTGESCILPIKGEGVHLHPDGSQQAIRYLLEVLHRDANHLSARWLLNIANMTLGTYPDGVPSEYLIDAGKFKSDSEFPVFPNVAANVGLDTFGLAGGVALDDFDSDGNLDVIASDWNTSAELRYFRSNGDGTFTDRSHEAGFKGIYGGLNLRHADYDNDGDIDVLVLRGGWMDADTLCANSLLENNGHGVFRDVTFRVGLGDVHYQTQTADWADFDNDGFLDLYIGNENSPNQLFKNTGHGAFVDVAQPAGVENMHYTKGVNWGDFNDDGFPDLYVSNLGDLNRLYRNNQNGTFTDVALQSGVSEPKASFPVWFWDFNNDGALDIYVGAYDLANGVKGFVADMLGVPHTATLDHLYQGDGRGGFEDVAKAAGVARVTLPMGSNYGDLDGDSFLDYYLGTGYVDYDALLPNRAFHNQAGKRFFDVSMASGMSHIQKGHGVAIADIDNDGDNDVFIVMGGAFPGDGFSNALFENPGFGNHWLTVKLVGTKTNRSAIGARVRVVVNDEGQPRSIYRWINTGGSFGGNPLRQEIGIGATEKIDLVEIYWPTSKTTQKFENVQCDQCIEITEGKQNFHTLPLKSFRLAKAKSPGIGTQAPGHQHDHSHH